MLKTSCRNFSVKFYGNFLQCRCRPPWYVSLKQVFCQLYINYLTIISQASDIYLSRLHFNPMSRFIHKHLIYPQNKSLHFCVAILTGSECCLGFFSVSSLSLDSWDTEYFKDTGNRSIVIVKSVHSIDTEAYKCHFV